MVRIRDEHGVDDQAEFEFVALPRVGDNVRYFLDPGWEELVVNKVEWEFFEINEPSARPIIELVRGSMTKEAPTKIERLILYNQFAILEFLCKANPDHGVRDRTTYHDADNYRRMQDVVAHGYDITMNDMFDSIYDSRLTYQDQKDILDILDMWNDLQWSFSELKEFGDLTEDDLKFPGWDGNSLKSEISFARNFCYRAEDEEKASRFSRIKPGPAVNGHFPVEDGYKRMLGVFRPLRQELLHAGWRPLTIEEMNVVLNAFAHPDSPKGRKLRGLDPETGEPLAE